MTTVRFSLGVSLLVLLIADITCYPLNKGKPRSSHQSGINSRGTTHFDTNFGSRPARYLPAFLPNTVSSSNLYMSGTEGDSNNPLFYRGPSSSVGLVAAQPGFITEVSTPPQPGYFADSYMSDQPGFVGSSHVAGQPANAASSSSPRSSSAASTQGGVAGGSRPAQPVAYAGSSNAPRGFGSSASRSDVGWVVPPPVFSGNRHASTHPSSSAGHNHGPAHAGDGPLLPPRPLYQPGQLSHFENNAENGNFERETEEIGYPSSVSSSNAFLLPPDVVFTSPGGPRPGTGGMWRNPSSYFDYMFLTGQYPPGTVSHFSQDFEHGRDYYQSTRYNKEHAPDLSSDHQTKQFAEPPD